MKCIVMEADTTSEFDSVDFAVLRIDETYIASLKRNTELLSEDMLNGIDGLYIYDNVIDYYSDDLNDLDDDNKYKEIAESIKYNTVIELPDDFFDDFNRPESVISDGMIRIGREVIFFSSNGKNTNDEFFCSIHKNNLFA